MINPNPSDVTSDEILSLFGISELLQLIDVLQVLIREREEEILSGYVADENFGIKAGIGNPTANKAISLSLDEELNELHRRVLYIEELINKRGKDTSL